MNSLNAFPKDKNAVVLLPTGSAARMLRGHLNRLRSRAGETVFRAPQILSINAWLKDLWGQVPVSGDFERPVLLTASQELAAWQEIIRASKWSDALLQLGPLSRSAADAYRLMRDWGISPRRLKDYALDECRALQEWCASFDSHCRQNHWLPECRLPDYLLALPDGVIDWPQQIRLHGFQEMPVAVHGFLDTLVERGTAVETLEYEDSNTGVVNIGFDDAGQEYSAAAAWAQEKLQENPESTVAIALTDMRAQVAELRRALDQALIGNVLYRSPREPGYECQAGEMLDTQPMIAAAMCILGQSHYRVELAELGRIIRSRYLAGADEEMLERARLDAYLRRLGELTPSIGFVAGQIVDKETGEFRFACSQLHRGLHDWRRAIDALPKTQVPSTWARDFSGLLSALGWPGALADQQLMSRWDDALSEMCALDGIVKACDIDTALNWLRRIVGEKRAPVTARQSRLHIISIEDAAIAGFDFLWLAGMDDDHWPPSARPNPLLPVSLQREAGIPVADTGALGRRAKTLLERSVSQSGEVVCSYAHLCGDREQRPSPLINDYPGVQRNALAPTPVTIAEQIFAARALETVDDVSMPLPATLARGGTSILKNQAACPFRAFVDRRLAATLPEEPEPGLDAAERGTLLHEVLETVWNTLGSHSGLVEADEAERERLVGEAAKNALEKMSWKKPETMTRKFLEIELQRLVARVMSWLYFEEQRDSFTVLKQEAERTIQLSGLQMKMRIDRIDQAATGERIIIDYKTGNAVESAWFGERPDEPQLPLYALSEIESGHEVAALGFARIRPNELTFRGISNVEDVLPGVKAVDKHPQTKAHGEWSTLIEEWRATLSGLAQDFVNGVAIVDPKDGNSCRYCEFGGVCRISELQERAGIVGDGDDGGVSND